VPLRDWVDRALQPAGIHFLALDAATAAESTLLPGNPQGDPADRFLMAAARIHDVALATRDRNIIDYGRAGFLRVLNLWHLCLLPTGMMRGESPWRLVREIRDGDRLTHETAATSDPLRMSQLDWPVIHELGLGFAMKDIWDERAKTLITYPNFWKRFYRKLP
jgi:hypothetical protein